MPSKAHRIVALDAGPARQHPTGVGVYVRDLARALIARDPARIALIGVRRDGPLAGQTGAVERRFHPGGQQQLWLVRSADRDASAVGARIAHWTNASAPPRTGRPFVLTIQDLSVIRHPLMHPPRRLVTAPLIAWSARRAAAIIVPSGATRDEVRRTLRVTPARIVVIPHAPSEAIAGGEGDALADAAARRALGLGAGRYILTIGTLEPRKNQARLVAAFERLAATNPDLRLVLVGGAGWRGRALEAAIEASPWRDRIVRPGYVDDHVVRAVLRGAAVFAYPSLYEGYGLPVVEALAAGIPVVTSRTSSLPEAAGGRAELVDPLDVASIADGLRRALGTPAPPPPPPGGPDPAARTWADVAGETLSVYDWVAARGER
jgi:glycosyltransferase involved in cell wall biosynthesis